MKKNLHKQTKILILSLTFCLSANLIYSQTEINNQAQTQNTIDVSNIAPADSIASSISEKYPARVLVENKSLTTPTEEIKIEVTKGEARVVKTRSASGDSLYADNRVIVSGGNTIIGNNNVIIVLDDKSKIQEAINLAKTGKSFTDNPKLGSDSNYSGKSGTQTLKKIFTEQLFDHFSIGLRASTFGPGIELATTLSRNLAFRAGFNFIDYGHNYNIETRDEKLKSETLTKDYFPEYKADGDISFKNGHVLFDIYPTRNGVFHFTAGAFLGKNRIKTEGRLINPNTGTNILRDPAIDKWSDISFADYQLKIEDDGSMNAEIEMGKFIKPYFGIGLGNSVPKNRFGIKFELGAVYQGDFIVKQNGHEAFKNTNNDDSFVKEGNYTKWLKWYPMVNLQLIYRFK